MAGALRQETGPQVGTAPRVAIATSSGLREIRHLARFLEVSVVLSPAEASRTGTPADVVLAWGRKPSAAAAERYARERGLPLWRLEDGWIRSASDDPHSRSAYSLLVDAEGVYYDSTSPSAIEQFLNRPDDVLGCELDQAALAYARRCRKRLVAANITKYNHGLAARLPPEDDRALVVVVDQTRDDASVRHGGMNDERFIEMLDAAVAENPDARVVVRTHPDVVAGRRRGYLERVAKERGIELAGAGEDPLPWLKRADRLYVGTSQLGYEALLCERPVTVFGQPFYAGWGLTDDRSPIPRRVHRRSLDELFHAAHVLLARYRSPFDGERWTLERCLEHVELQRHELARNAHDFVISGVTPWKRRYVRRFLRSPEGSIRFASADQVRAHETHVCWSFRDERDGRPTLDGATGQGKTWRMEDGFLRSAGLGSDFTAPGSLVLDSRGIYFDPTAPSDLEVLLQTRDCTTPEVARAARLRRSILEAGLSKYNVDSEVKKSPSPADRRHVLVVGQVSNDESIRRGCDGVHDDAALLQAVRKHRPDAWIVYRPHPDVEAGNRPGRADPHVVLGCADEVDAGSPIGTALDACDELHTMTSLTGFEALMRGKDVTTWGAPFYAGWGLTHDHARMPRRTRARTIDELVFLALIVYPRYLDVASGEFARPEDLVVAISRDRRESRSSMPQGSRGRRMRQVTNILRGLRYAP